ncbi:hypothetical protein LJC21_00465 [Bacteroides sp. OttesenSCG-928-E20]|nr:hypothetical protein [Bacteroides sp. OttesenSCG-928-E20]MDL2304653.1 hypothetical protein [Bacteroides sp. OttesenSCG-928-D19]
MSKQKILIIRFKNEIRQEDISKFRGAIVATMQNAHILFHNHYNEGFRYAYPLIQYKRINKKAVIVCIGEGTDVIGNFFSNFTNEIRIGNSNITLEIESVKANHIEIQLWNNEFSYRITQWLPFNQDNYPKYNETESLVERCKMLERILTGNMLSFAKCIGEIFDQQINCSITSIDHFYVMSYKGVKMSAFDVSFKSNLSLPDFIGLGKGVSLGAGTVTRKKDKNTKYNIDEE